MIRVRFYANLEDPRPVNWPIKHPYWITGSTYLNSIIVSYADDLQEIMLNWPEAKEFDVTVVDDYMFSDRFPKPSWMD